MDMQFFAGRELDIPLAELETRCLARITELEVQANPDKTLLALLCSVVRLTRDHADVKRSFEFVAKSLFNFEGDPVRSGQALKKPALVRNHQSVNRR